MKALLASAAVLALASCFSPPARTVEVRPIRIRVIDAATKRPLGGVPVAYALETMPEDRFRLTFNFSLPSKGPQQAVVLELDPRPGPTGGR